MLTYGAFMALNAAFFEAEFYKQNLLNTQPVWLVAGDYVLYD